MNKLFYECMSEKQTKRTILMLTTLYKHQHNRILINEMTHLLQISSITLLKDIEDILDILPEDMDLEIEERYLILHYYSIDSVEGFILKLAHDNPSYKILMSAFNEENLDMYDMADQLILSESTLRNRIRHLNKVLATYQLKISSYTIKIVGEETNIRYFYATYLSDFSKIFDIIDQKKYDDYHKAFTKIRLHLAENKCSILNFDFSSIFNWSIVALKRIELKKYVTIKKIVFDTFKDRASYLCFKDAYKSEIENELNGSQVSEEEVMFAYLVSLNSMIYIDDTELKLMREIEPSEQPLYDAITAYVKVCATKFQIEKNSEERFVKCISAYLFNTSLLNKISPIFQLCSSELSHFAYRYLPTSIPLWKTCLPQLEHLVKIDQHKEGVSIKLSLITSQFIYNKVPKARKILFSFSGEVGLSALLKSIANNLLYHHVEGVFIFNQEINQDIIEQIKPDILVCNYNHPYIYEQCRIFNMSYIPTFNEWQSLKEMELNLDYTIGEKLP